MKLLVIMSSERSGSLSIIREWMSKKESFNRNDFRFVFTLTQLANLLCALNSVLSTKHCRTVTIDCTVFNLQKRIYQKWWFNIMKGVWWWNRWKTIHSTWKRAGILHWDKSIRQKRQITILSIQNYFEKMVNDDNHVEYIPIRSIHWPNLRTNMKLFQSQIIQQIYNYIKYNKTEQQHRLKHVVGANICRYRH